MFLFFIFISHFSVPCCLSETVKILDSFPIGSNIYSLFSGDAQPEAGIKRYTFNPTRCLLAQDQTISLLPVVSMLDICHKGLGSIFIFLLKSRYNTWPFDTCNRKELSDFLQKNSPNFFFTIFLGTDVDLKNKSYSQTLSPKWKGKKNKKCKIYSQ